MFFAFFNTSISYALFLDVYLYYVFKRTIKGNLKNDHSKNAFRE